MRPPRRLSKAYWYPWLTSFKTPHKAYWYPWNASFKTSQQSVLVSLKCVLQDVSARRTVIPVMRPLRRLSKAYWYPWNVSFKTSQQGVLVSLTYVLQDVSARRTGITDMRPSRRLSKAYWYPWHAYFIILSVTRFPYWLTGMNPRTKTRKQKHSWPCLIKKRTLSKHKWDLGLTCV